MTKKTFSTILLEALCAFNTSFGHKNEKPIFARKMKRKRQILMILLLLILGSTATAQLEVTGELRPRFEMNRGFGYAPKSSDEPIFFISQRSRINVSFKKNDLTFYMGLQDVRVWGDENIATGTSALMNSNATGVHQAWLKYNFNEKSFLKIGRQELAYDDQRLLANRNWVQYGQFYDAVLFSSTIGSWHLDAALSYNNDGSKATAAGVGKNNFDLDPIQRRLRTLNFLYLKKQLSQYWYVSATGILSGYQKDKTSSTTYLMGTYGLHTHYQNKTVEGRVNFYLQNGKSQKGKTIKAWMLTAEGAFSFKKWRFGAGVDVLSGHDATKNETDYTQTEHNFDLLYGIRYLRYGLINQYVVSSSTLGGGLIDVYPKLQFNLNEKNKITADYHFFSLQQTVKNPLTNGAYLEGSLGSELDVVWNRQISKELGLNVGFAYYFTNDTYTQVKQISTEPVGAPYFGWVMLTFKPKIFGTE